MKKFALISAVVALSASAAFAGDFGGHTPAISAGADIAIKGANTAPVIAAQVNVKTSIKNVGKDVEISNQAVGSNISVESVQAVKDVDIKNYNSGVVAAVQLNGPVAVSGVGGAVSVSNVAVGANTSVKLTK